MKLSHFLRSLPQIRFPCIDDFKDYPDAYYKQAFSSYGSSAVAAKVVDALKASQIRISTKQRGIDS